MGGLRIITPSIVFSDYIDIVKYPVTDQLSSLYYLGGSAAASVANQAPGFGGGIAGASVTYQPTYGVFTGAQTVAANFIETADPDNASSAVTRIAVYRHVPDLSGNNNRSVYGMFAGVGSGCYMNAGQFGIATGSAVVNLTRPGSAPPDANFVFAAMTYDPTGAGTFTAYRGAGLIGGVPSLSSVVNSAAGARVGNALNDRIGGAASVATNVGETRIAAVAKHRRVLTATEIQMVYTYFRSRYAKLGLVVE